MSTVTRRGIITGLGGALVGAAVSRVRAASATWCAPPDARNWSELGYSGDVTISGTVVLDVSATVSTLTVPADARLLFHPDRTLLLQSSGNVLVAGTLEMQPTSTAQTHALRFVNINEAGYASGGCDPVASDVGLWVTGVLKTIGATKRGWSRAVGSITAGATSFTVDDATGWQVGDQLTIAPMVSHDKYSDVTVTAIDGNVVSCTATQNQHPVGPTWNGVPMGAEVCNLSRNVVIEGQPNQRAHILVHSPAPQAIRYAEIRYMGPRQFLAMGPFGPVNKIVLGRYALHFHSCQDGSRGTVVEGVTVHHVGGRAFVPHGSHGITFRDCIAHDGYEGLWWWDAGHVSSDITYERCVGSLVRTDPFWQGFAISAFGAMSGTGNRLIDCVAFGVQGNKSAAGFAWPEGTGALIGMWETRGCVSHNNAINGVFAWQNSANPHFISDMLAYRCQTGVEHGAYGNLYRYERVTVEECPVPVKSHAMSPGDTIPQRWVDCTFSSTGPHAIVAQQHNGVVTRPVEFHRCIFDGYTSAAFLGAVTTNPDQYDFIDCTYSGVRYAFPAGANAASVVRYQDGATASKVTPAGTSSIAPFFAGPLPPGVFVRGSEKPYTVICTVN